MKKIVYIFPLLILTMLSDNVMGQVEGFSPYYSNVVFNNRFTFLAGNDERTNYYAVDLSQFASIFEKVFFKELIFSDSRLVRVDAVQGDIIWVKADKNLPDTEIIAILNDLKKQTTDKGISWNNEEKQQWLTAHPQK